MWLELYSLGKSKINWNHKNRKTRSKSTEYTIRWSGFLRHDPRLEETNDSDTIFNTELHSISRMKRNNNYVVEDWLLKQVAPSLNLKKCRKTAVKQPNSQPALHRRNLETQLYQRSFWIVVSEENSSREMTWLPRRYQNVFPSTLTRKAGVFKFPLQFEDSDINHHWREISSS